MLASGSLKLLWNEEDRGVIYSYTDIHGNPEIVKVLPGVSAIDLWLPLQQNPYSHKFSGRLHLRLRCTWNESAVRGPMIPPKDVDWNNLESVHKYYKRLQEKQNASVLKIQRQWKLYRRTKAATSNIGKRLIDATHEGMQKLAQLPPKLGKVVANVAKHNKSTKDDVPEQSSTTTRSQSLQSSSTNESAKTVYDRSKSIPFHGTQAVEPDETLSEDSHQNSKSLVLTSVEPVNSNSKGWLSCFK